MVMKFAVFRHHIVRDFISYFFTLEKSTILPVAPCGTSYRTFSHPKKVRFYPSLRARPHIVLFHTRKKYDFTLRYLFPVHILIPTPIKYAIWYQNRAPENRTARLSSRRCLRGAGGKVNPYPGKKLSHSTEANGTVIIRVMFYTLTES